jgi:hypothetical protein
MHYSYRKREWASVALVCCESTSSVMSRHKRLLSSLINWTEYTDSIVDYEIIKMIKKYSRRIINSKKRDTRVVFVIIHIHSLFYELLPVVCLLTLSCFYLSVPNRKYEAYSFTYCHCPFLCLCAC